MSAPKREDDLPERVSKWLEQRGYPFELQVGETLRPVGFHDIYHGSYYRDRRTQKWREIDIRATRFISGQLSPTADGNSKDIISSLTLIVECKFSDRPWVVLRANSRNSERQFPSGMMLGRSAFALTQEAELLDGRGIELDAFGTGSRRGYGVVAAIVKEKQQRRRDAAYVATRQVLDAAAHVATEAEGEGLRENDFSGGRFFLPVVVLRGRLFEMTLDQSGEHRIEEVRESSVVIPSPGSRTMLVRIVTPDEALVALANRAIADVERVHDALRSNWSNHVRTAFQRYGLNLAAHD